MSEETTREETILTTYKVRSRLTLELETEVDAPDEESAKELARMECRGHGEVADYEEVIELGSNREESEDREFWHDQSYT